MDDYGTRSDIEYAIKVLRRLREAGAEDHPYGAWSGGSKAAGGHSGGGMRLKDKPFEQKRGGGKLFDRDLQSGDTKDLGGFGQNEGLRRAVKRVDAAEGITNWNPNEKVDRNFVDRELKLHYGQPVEGGNLLSRKPDSITTMRGGEMVVYHGSSGLPVGYVRISSTRGPLEGKISEVTIFKSERGKGYGTKMYDQIQDNSPINLYDHLGAGNDFTSAGKDFAAGWLRHRQKVERSLPPVKGQTTLFGEAQKTRRTPRFTATTALAAVLKATTSSKGMRAPEEP